MTIEFLPLEARHGTGGGGVSVVMAMRGRGEAIAAGHGSGGLGLLMSPRGLMSGGGEGGEPDLPIIGSMTLFAGFAGLGHQAAVGAGGGVGMEMRGRGREGAGGGVTLHMGARGTQGARAASYGFFVMQPPVVAGYGDLWFERVADRLVLHGEPEGQPTLVLREFVAFQASVRGRVEGTASAIDVAAFGSRMDVVFRAMLAEGIVFSATATITRSEIARVVARLVLGGHVATPLEGLVALLDALVLHAAGDAVRNGAIADTAVFGDWTHALYEAFAAVLERVLFSGQATGEQTLIALVRDGVAFAGAPRTEAEVLAVLRDAVGFMANINLDDGQYVAWVINARSTGLSRYTNYPFNSFARVGGRYYGASSNGIHRLEGTDDDGEDIRWRLRTGLLDMGTRRLKKIPEIFFGLATDGTMLVKAIIVGEDGEKAVAIYRMHPRPASNTREVRQKLGRGLEAIDWDFELEGVDGASIDLASIEFRPAFMERRTRG